MLEARRIPYMCAARGPRGLVYVPALLENIARAELCAFSAERLHKAPAPAPLHPEGAVVVFFLLALLLWHGIRAGWWGHISTDFWQRSLLAGGADSVRMALHHEWYRAITALTLHADSTHLLGNVAFGSIFCSILCRTVGLGVGVLLTIAGGALGNSIAVFVRPEPSISIGFSTALFASVGALSGYFAAQANQERRKALLPLAAGGAILAMLGTSGEHSDYTAHLCGLLAGAGLGALTALYAPPPLRVWKQWAAGLAALALVCGAWAYSNA